MTTSTDPKNTPSKGKWPSGATFMMYCAGVTLILLSASLVISGKPFSFSVEGDKVTLHGGLIPQGVPEEKAKENSAKLQQEFIQAKSTSAEMPQPVATTSAPFNGTWVGGGATYELVQYGNTVLLSEITNGITTAFGAGEADGTYAQLTVGDGINSLMFELFAESDTDIKITGPGIPENFHIRKL